MIAFSVVGAACGGGGDDDGDGGDVGNADVVGSYQVTSHRESHQQGTPVPCSDPGPEIEVGDPLYAEYFALAVDDFFDDPDFLVFQTCEGPGTGCTDTLISVERIDGRLESTDANTQTSGSSCNLHAGQTTLTVEDGVATLEDRRWFAFDHPLNDCTLEAAEDLIGTPDCRDVVVWVGTRL